MFERYELSTGRIEEIGVEENCLEPHALAFFRHSSKLLCLLKSVQKLSENNELCKLDFEEAKALNQSLYEELLPGNYEHSFANPGYIVPLMVSDGYDVKTGQCLCFLYAELRAMIPYAFENNIEMMTLFFELFIEVYGMFQYAAMTKGSVDGHALERTLYWFERDNLDIFVNDKVMNMIDHTRSYLTDYVKNYSKENESYLFETGEYISENELTISEYLKSLSEEQIDSIAQTFTNGYKIGFIKAGKPLEKKKTVEIRYFAGFERIIKAAIKQFDEMGLKTVIYRNSQLAVNRSKNPLGFCGAIPNKQFDYDHKDDRSLVFDKEYIRRRLDLTKAVFEKNKELASLYAGPAVFEVFGEKPFAPKACDEALKLSAEQQELTSEFMSKNSALVNDYIKGEERSFTIIAYPTPEIGEEFENIFTETVNLNNLDYKLYEDMQQIIIDELDRADKVHVVGKGNNRTDLWVNLFKLDNPDKETIFENCVADVNIPVGEVFTSPVLEGTNGVLHVPKVYLNSLKYTDLFLEFKDGVILNYDCGNYEKPEENRQYIKNNLLFNHETLPIGEFAIGTNTTAYAMARKYDISDRLPILIGEKTGPHFAIGDTCYSREEEVRVFNPDGKEIVAKSNSISDLRHSCPEKAYYSCHTDITIPYDEIEGIYAVDKYGNASAIIEDGKFVLEGLEPLNVPLNKMP